MAEIKKSPNQGIIREPAARLPEARALEALLPADTVPAGGGPGDPGPRLRIPAGCFGGLWVIL